MREATSRGTALAADQDPAAAMTADAGDPAAPDLIPEAHQGAEEEIAKGATLLRGRAEVAAETEETRAGLLRLVRAEAAQEATARAAMPLALLQDLSLDLSTAASLSLPEKSDLQRRKMELHLSLLLLNLV